MTNEQKENCNSLKEMIESCFTYGGAEKDSHNYIKYIYPYKEKLGKLFDKVYNAHLANLKKNYEITYNVHTDFEGLTYNSLCKKQS